MKIAAIITEYNPFHNGHLYQIKETKKQTGADAVVCIMSGNFTQRAQPAILNKNERAKLAIKGGADLVISIPTAYSINNAEIFAQASIKILNSFNNIKFLSFGMENPNINALIEVASFFNKEPLKFKKRLRKNLKKGMSFNKARINTLKNMIYKGEIIFKHERQILDIITKPNNILAIEYIRVLKKLKSDIEPIAIQRVGSQYYEKKLENGFSSATAIRENIYGANVDKIKQMLPSYSYKAILDTKRNKLLPDFDKYNLLKLYKMKTVNINELKKVYNVSEGLENLLKNNFLKQNNIIDIYKQIQTKRYKPSRIESIITNCLLNIDYKTVQKIYKIKHLPYIKIVAVNSNSNVLSHLESNTKLIIRKKDYVNLHKSAFVNKLLEIEQNANSVYSLITNQDIVKKEQFSKLTKIKRTDN